MRARAEALRGVADRVARVRSELLSALAATGRYSASADRLVAVVVEANDRAIDLEARAACLDRLTIDAPSAVAVPHVSAPTAGVESEAAQPAEEIVRLQQQIEAWAGGDNSPVLDELLARRRAAQRALGVTPNDLVAVAATMLEGVTPTEAGLPAWLFPQWYQDLANLRHEGAALVARLQRRAEELQQQLAGLEDEWYESLLVAPDPADPDRVDRLTSRMAAVTRDLAAVSARLARTRTALVDASSVPAPDAYRWVVDHPLVEYEARSRAAGAVLAALHAKAVADQDARTMSWVAATLADVDSSAVLATSFFNALGVEATSGIPDAIVQLSGLDHGGVGAFALPGEVVEMFSVALAKASRTGDLRFGGAELIEADLGSGRPTLTLDASYLFVASGFAPDFVVAAAAAYLPHGSVARLRFHRIEGVDGHLGHDSRRFFFAEIARLDAGVELMLAVADPADLLDPELGYDPDTLAALVELLADIPGTVDPATGMPTAGAVAATQSVLRAVLSAGGVQPGMEPALAAVVAPYLDRLAVQEDSSRGGARGRLERIGDLELTPHEIDQLIRVLVVSPAGADALYGFYFQYVVHQLVAAHAVGGEAALLAIEDELGYAWARIRAIELAVRVESARAEDSANRRRAIGLAVMSAVAFSALSISWPAALVGGLVSWGVGAGVAGVAELVWPTANLDEVHATADADADLGSAELRYELITRLRDGGHLPDLPPEAEPPAPPDSASDTSQLGAWLDAIIRWQQRFAEWARTQTGLALVVLDSILRIATIADLVDRDDASTVERP